MEEWEDKELDVLTLLQLSTASASINCTRKSRYLIQRWRWDNRIC